MKFRSLLLVFVVVAIAVMTACTPVATPSGSSGGDEMVAGGPCSEVTVGESDGMPDLQGCTLRIAVENAY
ncbi:MAG: hypothetical protein KDE19_14825, partial [Caldilineaceae bacterium]|nr:hypothetical protein [Caldilineaceae bacterium]